MTRLLIPLGRRYRMLSIALLAACGGCTHGNYSYTGVDPSVRTFNDNATIHEYYVGFDANFVVQDEEPHFHTGPTTRPISDY